MNALAEAKQRVQDAYFDERGLADVMRQDAAIYAAIAQAEVSRPRFVRLGDHTINLAHIAYINWHKIGRENKPCVEITFLAASNNAAMGLRFYDDECEPVMALLRQVLAPYTVAELDFPEPEEPPAPDVYAFTVLEQ